MIAWAAAADAGRSPDALAAWLRTSPTASARWLRLQEALGRLRRGDLAAEQPLLGVDLVARYVDGLCDADEAARVEEACWSSPADLLEVVSTLRFADAPPEAWDERRDAASAASDTSDGSRAASFVERLVAAFPGPTSARRATSISPPEPASGASQHLGRWRIDDEPVADATSSSEPRPESWTNWRPSSRPVGPGQRSRARRSSLAAWSWGAAAVALAVIVLGGIVWQSGGSGTTPRDAQDVAEDRAGSHETRREDAPPRRRSDEGPAGGTFATDDVSPREDGELRRSPAEDSPGRSDADAPRVPAPRRRPGENVASQDDDGARKRPKQPPAVAPEPGPPDPAPSAPTTLAMRSEVGAALVPGDSPGSWRVGRGPQPLAAPLRIVSLADSWTTADIPGVGTLVLDGESLATVSVDADRTVRVSLEQGRVGMRGLAEKTRVRFESAGQRWETTGVGDYATFAVVRDADVPSVFVSSGIIAVDQVRLGDGQVSDVKTGAVAPPQSLGARLTAAPSPFVPNPFDAKWLQAPDDRRRKEWQSSYGKLVDRLAAADDVKRLLPELRGAARDGRQHALLARWNLSLADDRAATLWEMLGDRQKFVRLAAARELLSIPPRDGRLRAYFAGFREQSDGATAAALLEWVGRSHRVGPLLPAQAMELVEGLGHQELALRQMAGLLLEYHLHDALLAGRVRPPAYDPDDPPGKRAAAQAQWKALVAQLFANRVRAGRAEVPK